MSILIFILILSFLILIHELGHFLAALWAGVKVEEFGIGYPPKALKLFKWRDTEFTLNLIPFGGFVRLAGEDGPKGLSDKLKLAKNLFYQKSRFKRLIISLAGVTVNFIFGIIAFSIIFSFKGIPTQTDQARIGYVVDNSPAAEAGLKINTNILGFKVGEEYFEIKNYQDVINFINNNKGQEVIIQTSGLCQGLSCQEIVTEKKIYLRGDSEIPDNQGSMGIAFSNYVFVFYPGWQMPFRASWYGLQQAVFLGLFILEALGLLIKDLIGGSLPQDIAGPVGIVHRASQEGIFEEGYLSLLNFAGMLSVNLAIMNLLPIPALDGGRAVFIFLEKFIGKKHLRRFEGYANYAGYFVLIALLVLVTIRDVGRVLGI